ncbi:MAG: helix-turn-helix transcriptional regulator [Acidobacteria bacterium]|nr:helix-turn-helix transcriptional regulator [Acidobacteriota bacterium]
MNQKEFAEAIGFSASFISDIESGKSKAGMDFFYILAQKYNINLYYLILGEGDIIDSKMQRPSLGNKKIGQSIETLSELLWYFEHFPIIFHSLLGTASRLIYENQEYLKKEFAEKEADK